MNTKEIVKEINVEKLNIVEPDGSIKMSLFNSKNIPSMILEGEDILPGHRENDGVSGAMFYNNEGDECGGFIYGSNVDENGTVSMGMSLTFDKYKQDQVLQLSLRKEGDKEQYGISIYDRPNKSIRHSIKAIEDFKKTKDNETKKKLIEEIQKDNAKRMFVGNDVDGQIKIALYDKKGNESLKIFVGEDGNPYFEISGKQIDLKKLTKRLY